MSDRSSSRPNAASSRGQYQRYKQEIRSRTKEQRKAAALTSPHSVAQGHKSVRRNRSAMQLFLAFWGLMREHRRAILLALVGVSLATLISLVPLYGTKLIFDNVLGDRPLPEQVRHILPGGRRTLLAIVCIAMIVLTVISVGVGNSSRWHATRIAKRVSVLCRRKAFDHAVRLPLHRVYELKSGGVTSILREDAGGVGELVFNMLYNPWRAVVQLIGCLIILAWVDWRLLIGSLLLLPTVWLTHRTWIGRIRPLHRDIRNTRTTIDSQATEAFGGMRVVRSFSRQKAESNRFTSANHLMARQEIYAWLWMRGIDAAWAVLVPLASAVLLWYGGNRVLADQQKVGAGLLQAKDALSVGDLVMFLSYLASLLGPIATLASSATSLQTNLAGLDRTLDLLDEPQEMPDRPQAKIVSKRNVEGRITLNDVSFSYARAKPHEDESGERREGRAPLVLRDISLDVLPGQTIALVGPSGAGKTTLCNLIARFYDPTSGTVELDGIDLRNINLDSYRRLLGIVEQDTFLFDGTIAQNISYGRRGATAAQVMEAAKQANAHDFITGLENGYETLIGERGVRLSGGQRQRLTIARAILADPKILILDEATSNLDTESERLIQNSLRTLMQGRTSFVIAHRLSTIAGADRILVIDNGRIIEQGTHEQLMSRSGRYQQMVLLQTTPNVVKGAPLAENAGV